ncbi:MAG: hypothetical protein JW699_08010 [Chitinispirillaceae bacterium]|nr:hypothetical protein [Chitinispirillaceae bacterium]
MASAAASAVKAPSTNDIVKGMIQEAAVTMVANAIFNLLSSPSTPEKTPEQLRYEQEQAWKAEQERIAKWNTANKALGEQLKGAPAATDLFSMKGSSGAGQFELKEIPSSGVKDAGAIDLRNKEGVVKQLTSAEEQKKRDRWYAEHQQDQMYGGLIPLSPVNGIDAERSPSWDENTREYLAFSGMLDKIAENPNGKLAAYIGKVELSIGKNVFKYLDDVKDAISNGTVEELVHNNPNPEQTVVKAVAHEFGSETIKADVGDKLMSAAEGAVKGLGGTLMMSAAGEKGLKDYETVLNGIEKACEIKDKAENALKWVGIR